MVRLQRGKPVDTRGIWSGDARRELLVGASAVDRVQDRAFADGLHERNRKAAGGGDPVDVDDDDRTDPLAFVTGVSLQRGGLLGARPHATSRPLRTAYT